MSHAQDNTGPQVDLWARMYATGLSYPEIARRIGNVTVPEVEQQLLAAGVPAQRPGGRRQLVVELIRRLHAQGAAFDEIVQQCFRSSVYVRGILEKDAVVAQTRPRYVYLLSHPERSGWVEPYSNLEALAADRTSGFGGTTRAIREARSKAGGYPVTVKGWQVDKKIVKGRHTE